MLLIATHPYTPCACAPRYTTAPRAVPKDSAYQLLGCCIAGFLHSLHAQSRRHIRGNSLGVPLL